MKRPRRYNNSRRTIRPKTVPANNFIRIVLLTLIIVTIASFYVYQRVWVRNLDAQIQELQKQNEDAEIYLASLKAKWAEASSIQNVEKSIAELKLNLRPTSPAQNYVLSPQDFEMESRYAGFFKAIEKLGKSIPRITSNEAEAGELFEAK